MSKLTVGSLFAGIGGFDLGLERTGGFEIKWQVEIDEYCRRVLEKHWPNAKRYGDIRTLGAGQLTAVDVICGGFPCQDISEAGKRAGIDGERSGLWGYMLQAVDMVRPRYAIVENVAALLGRGMGRVLGDLAEIGYDAEWDVIGADDFGASQHRERVWILAYPNNAGLQGAIWAGKPIKAWQERESTYCEPLRSTCGLWPPGPRAVADIPRMADGPAYRMDRLKGLGNAVVPQIVTWIGERILDHEHSRELCI